MTDIEHLQYKIRDLQEMLYLEKMKEMEENQYFDFNQLKLNDIEMIVWGPHLKYEYNGLWACSEMVMIYQKEKYFMFSQYNHANMFYILSLIKKNFKKVYRFDSDADEVTKSEYKKWLISAVVKLNDSKQLICWDSYLRFDSKFKLEYDLEKIDKDERKSKIMKKARELTNERTVKYEFMIAYMIAYYLVPVNSQNSWEKLVGKTNEFIWNKNIH